MEDLTARFRRSYWIVVHSMDALRLRAWEQHGLTLPQLRILFLIRRTPGITTKALARGLGLTVPTVSGLVDKLVRAGLVARGQREDDRRVIPLTLTDEGMAAAGEIQGASQAYLQALSADLGGDLAAMVAVLERLATAISILEAAIPEEPGDAVP